MDKSQYQADLAEIQKQFRAREPKDFGAAVDGQEESLDTQNSLNIENRIRKLEKQNRRLRIGFLAILAALIGMYMVGSTKDIPYELVTRLLRIVDETGATRASISALEDIPGLALFDKNERLRASIMVSEDIPVLALFDKNGKLRTSIAVYEDFPILGLADKNGKTRASIMVTDGGPGSLVLFNKDGKVLTQLP